MRRQTHGRASSPGGRSIGALNPLDFPIEVFEGKVISANRVVFDWQGPAMQIYLCWGMRSGTDFNNGAALVPAHNFASGLLNVPNSPAAPTRVDTSIDARLTIPPNTARVSAYDTYLWLAYTVSDQESEFVLRAGTSQGLIDIDSRVIEVVTQVEVSEAANLEISYVKV